MTNGSPAVISQSTIMLIRPVTQKAARMLVTIINFSYMVAFLALSEARTVHHRDSERSAVYKSILVSEMWTELFVCTPSRSQHI